MNLNWVLMVILSAKLTILKMENVERLVFMSKNLFLPGSEMISKLFQSVLFGKYKSNEKGAVLLSSIEALARVGQNFKLS